MYQSIVPSTSSSRGSQQPSHAERNKKLDAQNHSYPVYNDKQPETTDLSAIEATDNTPDIPLQKRHVLNEKPGARITNRLLTAVRTATNDIKNKAEEKFSRIVLKKNMIRVLRKL